MNRIFNIESVNVHANPQSKSSEIYAAQVTLICTYYTDKCNKDNIMPNGEWKIQTMFVCCS